MLFIMLGAIGESAQAAYPEKPINWIVPWPAGGRTDSHSRIFASALEKVLGQPVLVINKPGAVGVVGAKEVSMSKPDGYTVGALSITAILTQYTVPTPTNLKEYVPVLQLVNNPGLVTVNSKVPWKTLKEFIAYAKANPRKIKNATSGTGSSDHIFAAAFEKATGIKFNNIPYVGDTPAVAALAGGHVDATFFPMVSVKAFVDSGDMRVLGVASDKRRPQYPTVPTWKEQGVNVSISTFEGLYAPAGTPAEVVETLEKAMAKVVQNPEVIDKVRKLGLELDFQGHKDFVKTVADADNILREMVDTLGLRVPPSK
jgi:tripartite-type tricarboxylate transporter receptor subunit TctC